MAMARRKGEAHGDTLRVALLDAAGALLHAEGPQALTTRRLADAVGTSTQAIYTLFGGKEGIVRAMYREGFDRLEQCLADVPASNTSSTKYSCRARRLVITVLSPRPVMEATVVNAVAP